MKRRLVAAALVVSYPAYAVDVVPSDRPVLIQVQGGMAQSGDKVLDLPAGYYLNEPGMRKLNEVLAGDQIELARLGAENKELKKQIDSLDTVPWLPIVLAVTLGVGAGFAASKALK